MIKRRRDSSEPRTYLNLQNTREFILSHVLLDYDFVSVISQDVSLDSTGGQGSLESGGRLDITRHIGVRFGQRKGP